MKDISAIIMAAGKGTRLLPITSTTPKPLIRLLGKTLLEYNLENIAPFVEEIIIVVSYLKEKIIDLLGNSYKGIKINYAYQDYPKGTAHALFVTKDLIKTNHLLILNADDIYDKKIILKILKSKNSLIVGKKETDWKNYGILQTKKGRYLNKIIEKPQRYVGNLVNIGLYKVDLRIFKYFKKIKKSPRGEYEITDMFTKYAKENKLKIIKINSGWHPLTYPWDLLSFSENLSKKIKTLKFGKVEENVCIKGKLYLGHGSIIKSGTCLEGNFYIGDNCLIGQNCYLKGFASIDNNSNIGNAVEITRSLIGKNTNIKEFSYIKDSILGNSVNIGKGTIISNLKPDRSTVLFEVNAKLIDSKRENFGAVIGDYAKTKAHTTFYPGTKLEAYSKTLPGQIVK